MPDGVWIKCIECSEIIYNGELSRNLRICPKCDYYFPLEPAERIAFLVDRGSLLRYDADDTTSGLDAEVRDWAIITGEARLSGRRLVIAGLNLNFANEDIGLFVCEKLVKAIAQAIDLHLPFLLACTDGTGLQAQNGTFLPARTLSTSAALGRLAREKLLYISLLAYSDPHDHFPGFAYVADIVMAESNVSEASRAGDRKREDRSAESSQSLFQSGMVDMIVSRRETRQTLASILKFFY
jgi:acetyl-CoA carboxylase carboxyl transferase subunit beta